MKEHIYTIPINDQFRENDGCPLCGLYQKLEKNEIEAITGASMMEPAVRIKTNELGFCHSHFEQIAQNGKRLPVALVLQSHLEEVRRILQKKNGCDSAKYLSELQNNCYVCCRVQKNMESIYSNLFYLYRCDENFRTLFKQQKLFCLPHYQELLSHGFRALPKKEFSCFAEALKKLENAYLDQLQEDIDWFCKKFDYRYKEEDWKNSRDAIERTVYTLTGKAIDKPESL